MPAIYAREQYAVDKHFNYILARAEECELIHEFFPKNNHKIFISKRISYLWSAVVSACITLLIHVYNSLAKFTQPVKAVNTYKNIVIVKSGTQTRFTLSRGIKVWINAENKITYSRYNKTFPGVELEGEFFFDQTKL